jgi:hypothetical protein
MKHYIFFVGFIIGSSAQGAYYKDRFHYNAYVNRISLHSSWDGSCYLRAANEAVAKALEKFDGESNYRCNFSLNFILGDPNTCMVYRVSKCKKEYRLNRSQDLTPVYIPYTGKTSEENDEEVLGRLTNLWTEADAVELERANERKQQRARQR